jgi:hypothetical protein
MITKLESGAVQTEIGIYPGQVTFFAFYSQGDLIFNRPTATLPAYVPVEPTYTPASPIAP